MTDIPLDADGAPDLQALVHRAGGYQHITIEEWAAFDRANLEWQQRRRAGLAPSRARQ